VLVYLTAKVCLTVSEKRNLLALSGRRGQNLMITLTVVQDLGLCVLSLLHLPYLPLCNIFPTGSCLEAICGEPSRGRFPCLYSKAFCAKNSFTQSMIHSSLVLPRYASCLDKRDTNKARTVFLISIKKASTTEFEVVSFTPTLHLIAPIACNAFESLRRRHSPCSCSSYTFQPPSLQKYKTS
jgi:hypothetical protein